MSTSPQDTFWHRVYEAMTQSARDQIDELYNLVYFGMKTRASCDDRAECLVAAITRYVVESAGSAEIRAGLSSVTVPIGELSEAVELCESTDENMRNLTPEQRERVNAGLARDHAFLTSQGLATRTEAPII